MHRDVCSVGHCTTNAPEPGHSSARSAEQKSTAGGAILVWTPPSSADVLIALLLPIGKTAAGTLGVASVAGLMASQQSVSSTMIESSPNV